jgi:hypothetical protein
MDKHDRLYRCSQPECSNLNGFTYSGGLLRHEREVHFKLGGPEAHRCNEHECSNLPGFVSASVLLRHTREVHSKRGGPKEILRCPIDECKRHVGKAFSRMDGLVKHLAAIHGIKKSSAEVRRDYSFRSESPNRQGSRESVGEHENVSPGPRLQEIIAPREQFKFFDDKTVELKEEQRELKMRNLLLAEERLRLNVRLEQHDIDPRERQNLRDEVAQLALREQQNKAQMLTVQQELDIISPQSATPLPLSARLDPHEQRDHDMRSIWEDVEPRGDTMNAEDAAAVLRRHQAQLMTLEQQNEIRVSMTQQEQDSPPPQPAIPSPSPYQLEPLPGPDYKMQLMLLEQKNKKRLLMERDDKPPEGGHPCFMEECVGLGNFGTNDLIVHLTVVHGFDEHVATNYVQSLHTANLALQDYQMQLMLLDMDKDRCLLAAQQEQNSLRSEPTTTLPRETSPPAGHNYHEKARLPERENMAFAQQGAEGNYSVNHDLMNNRLQAAGTARLLAPATSSISRERSAFKHGSPLAPSQRSARAMQQPKDEMMTNTGTANNDQSMHREVEYNSLNDSLLNPIDYDGAIYRDWFDDGKRLPGVQSIVEGSRRLQSEQRLERSTFASSSNSHDSRLLNRSGVPSVSQINKRRTQVHIDWETSENAKAKRSRQVHADQFHDIPDPQGPDWKDYVLADFEDMPGEEVERLFGRVCCRVKHCL